MVVCAQMLDELYNNKGWTVSHESEVKVTYRHIKGESCSRLIPTSFLLSAHLCAGFVQSTVERFCQLNAQVALQLW